jgi:hypothetical protein
MDAPQACVTRERSTLRCPRSDVRQVFGKFANDLARNVPCKCFRISPSVLGSATSTRCSTAPSRHSLFRSEAAEAAKSSSASRLSSGLAALL